MESINEVKDALAEMEKVISLRQIALQSGVNYVTLRNIKFGKSQRLTEGVITKLANFKSTFSPDTTKPEMKKRGRRPKEVAEVAPVAVAAAPVVAPAPTEIVVTPPPVAAPVAPKAAKRVVVKKRAKKADVVSAPKKRGRVAGKKYPVKKLAVKAEKATEPITHARPAVSMAFLGTMLDDEIRSTSARLEYLQSLKKIELEYLKKINSKG